MNSSDIPRFYLHFYSLAGFVSVVFFQSPSKKTILQSLFHTFSPSSPFLYASLFFTCSPTIICLQG
ncbi:hypothetical protein BKA57DRAFT_470586, partial [Linnemannia elongata]